MRFVVAGYGSRGDVEPCAAVALELLRRGNEVRLAVPPNLLGFVESAGLAAVAYGPDSREEMNPGSDLVRGIAPKLRNPINVVPDVVEHVTRVKLDKSATLTGLAEDTDLILASFNEQGLAANVAEYQSIPLAGLHLFPERIWSSNWLFSRMTEVAEAAQRRALGLPETSGPVSPPLEIQAYDELCLPGPAGQWVEVTAERPFVGAIPLELPTDFDEEVLLWIATGTPPIYFGLGSTPVTSPSDTFAMIAEACAQLGERLLFCAGPNDLTGVEHSDHVKVVSAVNHSAVFPRCRAIVHHGGAGTTAAALRAGIPSLILWQWLDQPLWAAAVQQLEVGVGRHFWDTTGRTLVADLQLLVGPQYVVPARQIGARMTKPAESRAMAADLLEAMAGQRR
jgi:UDP:flavonoid glycosyltransferase YjiC (YdhE family)